MSDDAVKYQPPAFNLPDNVIFVRPAPWETVVLEPIRRPIATPEMGARVVEALGQAQEYGATLVEQAQAAIEAMGYDLPG